MGEKDITANMEGSPNLGSRFRALAELDLNKEIEINEEIPQDQPRIMENTVTQNLRGKENHTRVYSAGVVPVRTSSSPQQTSNVLLAQAHAATRPQATITMVMPKPKISTILRSIIKVTRLLMAYAASRDLPQGLRTAHLTEVHQELKALGRALSVYLVLGLKAVHLVKEIHLIESNQLLLGDWLENTP